MLRIEGLTSGYSAIPVLNGVSIKVDEGQFVAIVGPNGAGKTTLFRTISGIVRPSAGTITFGDHDLLSIRPAQREHLGIAHLKLVMGISLGGMLTWMFGEMFPDFMHALMPIASQPGPMSGRNWIQRKINVEAIRNDPEWKNGDYETQPTGWVRVAPLSGLMTQSVVRIQETAGAAPHSIRFICRGRLRQQSHVRPRRIRRTGFT